MSVGRFFHRARWDGERARELDAHLAIEIDENLSRGMSACDARAAARRKLGNTTLIREEIYRMNTIGLLDTICQDLRYGARLLRLNPGFAAVAILSLALGVGANTAIFELLDAVRIRTLPVAHPEQLVEIRIPQGVNDNRSGCSARTLLFGLQPHDPATLVTSAVSLAIVAALASYLPALRASRLEPTEALREQ